MKGRSHESPPYLLEMYQYQNSPCSFGYSLLQSVADETEAVRVVKTIVSFWKDSVPDKKKFRLFMGESYGYKYYNRETENFEFEVA